MTHPGPSAGRRPRLLLLSMYPLDQGLWGPTVRISHLRDELSRLADLDVIAGYRGVRRVALLRYAASGRLRGLDGVYVESSSFLPSEADVAFLALARGLGVPVLTYVRDAYQLFPDEYPPNSWRRKLAAAAFRPAIRALRAVSSRLGFPTAGLATAVLGDDSGDAALLPPGSPPPVDIPRAPDANRLLFVGDGRLRAQGGDRLVAAVARTNRLLFVGDGRLRAQGGDRLVAAVARARELGASVELTVVSRPGQEPPGPHPDWLHLERAEGAAVHALLPNVIASVIPRPISPYNDLALPVKLFEYLSYGRPLIVTDCREQARVVRESDAGLVTGDAVADIARGIEQVASASGDRLGSWSAASAVAAREASWSGRAVRIAQLLADLS